MEKYTTAYNSKKIDASFNYTSKAKRFRKGKFYLINKDNPNDVEILIGDELEAVTFTKKQANKRAILMMRIQLIVTEDLLPNKKKIMQDTLVEYVISDGDVQGDYVSDFAKTPLEYRDKTKYTFLVTKQVEIELK